jgi:hypothetical protein
MLAVGLLVISVFVVSRLREPGQVRLKAEVPAAVPIEQP